MLPPPAPTLEISVESALMIRSCSSSNVLLTNGSPSTTSETSVDVPPTSQQSRFRLAERLAERVLEIVPAAGPAKTIRNGCSSASRQGSSVAAQSAKLSSPSKPSARELGVELARVVGEDELHEDVDDRRRRARVLLGERRGLGGDRDRDVAEHLAGELARAAARGRVDVGVEQADRDALDAAALEHLELRAGAWPRRAAAARCRRRASARDAAAQVARHERPRGVAERAAPARVGLARRAAARRGRGRACRGALGGQEARSSAGCA